MDWTVVSLNWKFPYGKGDLSDEPRAESVKSEFKFCLKVLARCVSCENLKIRFFITQTDIYSRREDLLRQRSEWVTVHAAGSIFFLPVLSFSLMTFDGVPFP